MNMVDRQRVAEALDLHLQHSYAQNAEAAIRRPDGCGAFPSASLHSILGGESLLVVPDTNVLLRDIAYSCLKGRTVLITAANSGAVRLFCAEHVIVEVLEHSKEWAFSEGIPHETYVSRWNQEYLPLMRTIPAHGISNEILSPAELSRVNALGASKDIPSVVLSLALGAFYLTEDRGAWRAVYGANANHRERFRWLDTLKAGGKADELGELFLGSLVLPAVTVQAVAALCGDVIKAAPWILAPIAGLLGWLAFRTSRETYGSIGSGLLQALTLVADVYKPYHEALDQFRRMAPSIPTWNELAQTNGRRSVLARAVMYELARSSNSDMSATELARELPDLHVGQRAHLVRDTFRASACFSQPYLGRWQLGHTRQPDS